MKLNKIDFGKKKSSLYDFLFLSGHDEFIAENFKGADCVGPYLVGGQKRRLGGGNGDTPCTDIFSSGDSGRSTSESLV